MNLWEDNVHLNTVIYTNKLEEVLAFYKANFNFMLDETIPNGLAVLGSYGGNGLLIYLDAEAYNHAISTNVVVRVHMKSPEIEHERLERAQLSVTAVQEADWGKSFGTARYFELTDPSGNSIQLFEDHIGEVAGYTLQRTDL